jgi:hypothetical protein
VVLSLLKALLVSMSLNILTVCCVSCPKCECIYFVGIFFSVILVRYSVVFV